MPSTEAEQPIFRAAFEKLWVEYPISEQKCATVNAEHSCVVSSWRDPTLSLQKGLGLYLQAAELAKLLNIHSLFIYF